VLLASPARSGTIQQMGNQVLETTVEDASVAADEPTLARASLRAAVAFLVVLAVGGCLLWLMVQRSDPGPIASVATSTVEPATVRAPERPERYPDALPTLDDVALMRVRTEPGAILAELASPTTPAEAVAMVQDALTKDGWETGLVSSPSRLMGSATKGDQLIAFEVTGDERSGVPKGWITINILIKQDTTQVPPPVEPVRPPDSIS
jgi:hypothetical protein